MFVPPIITFLLLFLMSILYHTENHIAIPKIPLVQTSFRLLNCRFACTCIATKDEDRNVTIHERLYLRENIVLLPS